MRVLDSHLHLWDPAELDYAWLEGPLASAFTDRELDRARVAGASEEWSVFIQADCAAGQELDEVRWVTASAAATGVRAIVAGGRLDLGVATDAHLAALAEHSMVVGVRHLLQSEPDGFALTPAFVAGARAVAARGWSFDVCVRGERQLTDAAGLADAVPELRMVLDHLGKPVVGTASAPVAPSAEWVDAVEALAQYPQVFCKLSGLPAEAGGDWSLEQLEPFLDAAAAAFGAERLMWGSDWPVSAVGSSMYQSTGRTRWAKAVASWAAARGHDVDAIMHANAAGFYRVV